MHVDNMSRAAQIAERKGNNSGNRALDSVESRAEKCSAVSRHRTEQKNVEMQAIG